VEGDEFEVDDIYDFKWDAKKCEFKFSYDDGERVVVDLLRSSPLR
jgi:hypothetical protein